MNWTEAYTNVQDALAKAKDPAEIWVAKGVYYPDIGSGQVKGSITASFVLTDGVSLYGGFDHGDLVLTDRDWVGNHTVLSGDIDENDTTDVNNIITETFEISGNNSRHVLFARGVTGTAVLDGFYVTAGQAFGPAPHFYGGGMHCDGSGSGNHCNPTLRNLTFSGNQASDGGALYNNGSDGGESSPTIHNATFTANDAGDGGAIFNHGDSGTSSPKMTMVTFTRNTGSYGAVMYNNGRKGFSKPEITNAVFTGNESDDEGGVMYNDGDFGFCMPVITNALFSGNYAHNGGVMFNVGNQGICSPVLTNATFSGNEAGSEAGVMFNNGYTEGTVQPQVRNSILWNNKDKNFTGTITATIHNINAAVTFSHSLVQDSMPGGIWLGGDYVDGGGNIDQDPLFITPVEPFSAPTTTGNLRLQPGSPAIDKGLNDYIIDVPTDLDGQPRITDGIGDLVTIVDMGAYERERFYKFVAYINLPLIIR
jgi:hypothetical protein